MAWDPKTAAQLADAQEIEVVVPAPDRPAVRTPIWVVTVDGDLYIRSWKGENGRWYRRVRRYGTGSVVVGGHEHAVRFLPATDSGLNAQIDEAYVRKYGHNSYSRAMTRAPATATTTALEPVS
jgi:hypothetical protein